jgi:CHAT domain-containing protein
LQAINRLRANIMYRRETGTMETDRNNLYNALIKPALVHIPDKVQNIIIVPDGTLGHLPFDILRENPDSPDLGETYRLSLSPSVSVSMLAGKTAVQNLPVLAFGGAWYDGKTAAERGSQRDLESETETDEITWSDLPGTEAEVKKLGQIVPAATDIRVFLGGDVSEEQVKRLSGEGELARYPILHFATHGYFKEEDLERAGIVLSEVSGLLDNDEDGYLTIPEIAVLNLDAQMVLLSACETGLGLLKRGDGMIGMIRAFLIAGAKYAGVSLWSIDDGATVEFMTRLYGKVLNEGITFKEAYYRVKNEFRHDKELNHPFYWSAFVIYE